jgi:hypothetical protein
VLLPYASQLDEVNALFKTIVTKEKIAEIVHLVPDDFLQWDEEISPAGIRQGYIDFISTRFNNAAEFIKEANNARATVI